MRIKVGKPLLLLLNTRIFNFSATFSLKFVAFKHNWINWPHGIKKIKIWRCFTLAFFNNSFLWPQKEGRSVYSCLRVNFNSENKSQYAVVSGIFIRVTLNTRWSNQALAAISRYKRVRTESTQTMTRLNEWSERTPTPASNELGPRAFGSWKRGIGVPYAIITVKLRFITHK